MPHFKCERCRARLYSEARSADAVGELCPGCGSLLEPVGELGELVGFRSIKPRAGVADGAAGTHRLIADRVDDFHARREATVAQSRADADRWLDDGGSFCPDAVAEAVALPPPEENP